MSYKLEKEGFFEVHHLHTYTLKIELVTVKNLWIQI